MPYFTNEQNGRVVMLPNKPAQIRRLMEEGGVAYQDSAGKWRKTGWRESTKAEIKAHQEDEAKAVAARSARIESRRQSQAKSIMNINSVDPQALIAAMNGGEKKDEKPDA